MVESTEQNKHTGRRIAVALLIILGCLSLAFANVATWARDTVLNTDAWVAAVGPLSKNPAVAATISDAIVTGISDELGVTPPEGPGLLVQLGILEKPLVEMIQEAASEAIAEVIVSDEFNEIWVTANEVIHSALVSVLTGDNPFLYAEEGIVYLDLNQLLNEILELIGLGALALFDVGGDVARFPLIESETLAEIQRALRILDNLALLSVLVMFLSFVGAWALSKWRKNTVISIGISSSVTMILFLIVYNVAEALLLSSIIDPLLYDLMSEVVGVLTSGLVTQSVLLLVLGLVIAGIAWVWGERAGGKADGEKEIEATAT